MASYVWGAAMPATDSPVLGAVFPWAKSVGRHLAVVFGVVACLYLFGFPGHAATGHSVIIQDDRGGAVIERVRIIENYRQTGTRVEIRGDYCLSACTLYLGLPDTCVAPETVFGFHGPSSPVYGVSLAPQTFDRWSRVMAEHYPKPIRAWFLREGRHRTVGFYNYSGSDLIRMGIKRCANS